MQHVVEWDETLDTDGQQLTHVLHRITVLLRFANTSGIKMSNFNFRIVTSPGALTPWQSLLDCAT